MIKANDAGGLVVLAQVEPIAVVFTIPQDNLPPVLARQRAGGGSIAVDAYDREGRTKLGDRKSLVAVDNQIDATTGTVKLKASFVNADGSLFPNQFVNARILVDSLQGRGARAERGDPARGPGPLRVPGEAGQDGRAAQDQPRAQPRAASPRCARAWPRATR